LNNEDQFDTPAKIDGIISAEIPADTMLYNIVAKFMIHRPCEGDKNARCMKDYGGVTDGMVSPCCLIQTLSVISPLATESDSSVTPASPVTPRKRVKHGLGEDAFANTFDGATGLWHKVRTVIGKVTER
jgi:hypothetical protein